MAFPTSCHYHLPWTRVSSCVTKTNVRISVPVYSRPRSAKHWMNCEKIRWCAKPLVIRFTKGSSRPKRLSGQSIAGRSMPGNLNATCQYSKIGSLRRPSIIYVLVCIQHALEGKVRFNVCPATGTRNIKKVINQGSGMCSLARLNEKTRFAVTNDLFCRTASIGDNRCTGSHSLDGSQAKRFVPLDRKEQAKRLTHNFPQGQPFQLSQVGHLLARPA